MRCFQIRGRKSKSTQRTRASLQRFRAARNCSRVLTQPRPTSVTRVDAESETDADGRLIVRLTTGSLSLFEIEDVLLLRPLHALLPVLLPDLRPRATVH